MSAIICASAWCHQCRLTVPFCSSLHLSSPPILFYYAKSRLGHMPHNTMQQPGSTWYSSTDKSVFCKCTWVFLSFFPPYWVWFLSSGDKFQVIGRYFAIHPSTPVYSQVPSLLQLVMPFLVKHGYFCVISLIKVLPFRCKFIRKRSSALGSVYSRL